MTPILTCMLLLPSMESGACTSAIISAEVNPYGRPILWKHRDTSTVDNKVEYVAARPGELSYVALFNAGDKYLKEAWMGMNEAGFAVMNTASYNIKDDKVSAKKMDKEGYVMTKALKTCRTVDDFARLLETLPRPMGVEANFGVIDATGNGAYFETNNHSYRRFDLKDAENGVLVRTNYSHSGRPDEGFGFVREANACHLLDPYVKTKSVTPEVLTEELSRSFYHDMNKRDYSSAGERWVIDQDFIPRYKSTATIAIEGCRPVSSVSEVTPEMVKREYVMWTGLGYPPCAETRAVTCAPDGVDKDLRGSLPNGHSPLADKAKKMRDEVFPIHKGNGDKYIDMEKLFREDGTGYVQKLKQLNVENFKKGRENRDGYGKN
ncbi:carcinine hydrolase/isopenicillin-N N-acyltransferase family protein [Sangeribacter muris]|uniref:carcinine hydrolase/isopenicillin-N N-acyltransferase family protein n=1 Tax=Sangeribacter muris TaxID=2880703 RepID=UPI0013E8ED0C|nr:carcinine hydrolase/isopenicillin-N N-acyltransferase family protein [Sangeribacter muris]